MTTIQLSLVPQIVHLSTPRDGSRDSLTTGTGPKSFFMRADRFNKGIMDMALSEKKNSKERKQMLNTMHVVFYVLKKIMWMETLTLLFTRAV
jgi:hypothetical protein